MVLVTETLPTSIPSINQKSDIQAVPVGQEDNWWSASDSNKVGGVVVSLGRAVQFFAAINAVTPATQTINKKVFRFDGTKLVDLFRANTSLVTDLNKRMAAAIEEIEQQGDRDGTASNTGFFGVRTGVVSRSSGTFITSTLYTFSSDGFFPVTYVSGTNFPPIAVGLNERTAFVNLNGLLPETDGTDLDFDSNGRLRFKSTGTATMSTLHVIDQLTVSGTVSFSAGLDVDGATNLDGTLAVSGASTFSSAVNVNAPLTVTGLGTFNNDLNVNGLFQALSQALFNRTVNFTSLAVFQNVALFEDDTQYKHFSPAQITSDQNDFNMGDTTGVRLSTDASRTVTGLVNGTDGRFVLISNVGSFDLILAHQNASSVAANRIISPTAQDVTIIPNDSIVLQYDSTTSRWRIISMPRGHEGGRFIGTFGSPFTTVTIAAAASASFNITGAGERGTDVTRLGVQPSVSLASYDLIGFRKDTFSSAQQQYKLSAVTDSSLSSAKTIDRVLGMLFDEDTSYELHFKIINNGSQGATFNIEYEGTRISS